MKKEALLLLIFILTITIASATYECSNSSEMTTDQEEININQRKSVNGLGIAVTYADEVAAIGRITAELLINAQKVLLSNSTLSEEVKLLSKDYTVTLINASDSTASIDVEGDTESLEEGETATIEDAKVYLINAADSSGSEETELIIATNQLSLDNNENQEKLITIDTEYLIELFSASDSNAIIIVKKCTSGEFVEISDTLPPEINSTNVTITNTTGMNTTTQNTTITNSTGENNQTPTNLTTQNNESTGKPTIDTKTVIITSSIISSTILAIVLIYLKIKRMGISQENINQDKNKRLEQESNLRTPKGPS